MKDKHKLSQIAVALGLAGITFAVFQSVLRCDFVEYDDQIYVTNNYHVVAGLTWRSVLWAFTNLEAGFWHPLTWLSHMLDCQLYGLWAGGHHLTNLILHTANVVLLFVILRRMTGALWRSAMVAGLFALHPLHVESVAWVSERKDVLSTLFWMLTLLMYVRYVEASEVQSPKSKVYYGWALAMFVCGLMSKAMVVTLPVVLLLLDWWPLQRISNLKVQGSGIRTHAKHDSRLSTFDLRLLWRLVWEKAPFFGASLLCGLLTMHAEKVAGALPEAADYPVPARIANAAYSFVWYLEQTFWPRNMTVFYPYVKTIFGWTVIWTGMLLVIVSICAIWLAKRRGYVTVGWFWYVTTLLPVIGVIQVGEHARADRYTYLPLIGVFIAVVWGMTEMVEHWRAPRVVTGIMAALVLGACALGTMKQLRYWQDTESLFTHLVAVTKYNYAVFSKRGIETVDKKKFDKTVESFQAATKIEPSLVRTHINLGNALAMQGKVDKAIKHYREALRISPNNSRAHCYLGDAFAVKHKYNEAIMHYAEALRLAPNYARAHDGLGYALAELGRLDEAVRQYDEALKIDPTYADAHLKLGITLAQMGRRDEAVAHLREALRLKPNNTEAKAKLHALGVEVLK